MVDFGSITSETPTTLDCAMPASAFASINKNEWKLSDDTPNRYRELLHGAMSFEAIVRELCARIRIIEVHRNKAESAHGYSRAHVKVKVHRDACTMFHSGRSGYRAQYYDGISNGERANAFAVRSITKAILSQLSDTRLMSVEWIEQSLLSRNSKVWVHQGQWLRYARRSDRLLIVERWHRQLASDDKKRRKLALWASLVPQQEDRIDIKGEFLTLDARPIDINPKQGRSKQLYELGFT